MKTEIEVRMALRQWIVKTSGKIQAVDLADDTPIIERRIISSLQLMDLILMLEKLSGNPIDAEMLRPGAFQDINSIYENFFAAVNVHTN
jgi:acyl carrier protein